MTPGIRAGQLPPFHELDEYIFQDLCRDLFDAETEIATCEIYGKRGQSQYGIDILAHRINSNELEVGQCKCNTTFTDRQIAAASDEFFKHYDARWSHANVKRFILFAACDLKDKKCQDEILKQKQRFAQFRIGYEAWGAAQIQNKLRPHRGIASTYLPQPWVEAICGPTQASIITDPSASIVSKTVELALTQAAELLSETTIQGLDQMREAWREGRTQEALHWLQENRSNQTKWALLSSLAKAKMLCFEASLELSVGGTTAKAQALIDEAHSNEPIDAEVRIRAVIAFREGETGSAIDMLADRSNIDDVNLKALLLLVSGDTAQCLSCLDLTDTSLVENTETHRVRALAFLVTKDVERALIEIEKAHILSPMWEDVRIARAVILYYSTLAPCALPEWPLSWPEPVDWEFVKRDDDSLARLREAAEVFDTIAMLHEPGSETRYEYETWRLACLANDPMRQEVAVNYCKDRLSDDPANHRLIAWVFDRRLEIDLEPSIQLLEDRIHDGTATAQDIIALAPCYLRTDRPEAATELLANSSAFFLDEHAEAVRLSWSLQIAAQFGDANAILEQIDALGQEPERFFATKTIALRALANQSGDWHQLQAHLERCYAETNDPKYLLESCQLRAQQNDWDYIAKWSEQLVSQIQTGASLALAAFALFNTRNFGDCLELLRHAAASFPQNRLPAQLRRMRLLCQQELGINLGVIVEAEQLERDEPSIENQLVLARLFASIADLTNVEIIARRISLQDTLTASQALEISSLVRLQNLSLARDLWRRAATSDLPNGLAVAAMSLGFELGLDIEVNPLLSRIRSLAAQGSDLVQMISIADLVAKAHESNNRHIELMELYHSGTVPVHMIASALRIPLAHLYHQQLLHNESDPGQPGQFALFIRHGRRPIDDGAPMEKQDWRINIDITALLLAQHVELLTCIEQTFAPLRIPPSLPSALLQIQEGLANNHPSSVQRSREVVRLVGKNRITILDRSVPENYENPALVAQLGEDWVAAFTFIQQSNGLLIDFLPLHNRDLSGPPIALPDGAMQCIGNCRTVVELLRTRIPDSVLTAALEHLGNEGQEVNPVDIPPERTPIYCDSGISEQLAGAGLLEPLCRHYHVHISSRELRDLQHRLELDVERQATQAWLRELIDHVNRGIHEGTYQLIPLGAESLAAAESADSESEKCLFELLSLEYDGPDVVWIDDRFASAYSHGRGAPIVGIVEVAKKLLASGAIDQNLYYNTLLRLRSANVHFLPITSNEVRHFLKRTTSPSGQLVETAELRTLRQATATSLLMGTILQKPGTPEIQNPVGEANYVLSLTREIIDAIVKVWEIESDLSKAQAQAEWLYANLFLPTVAMLEIANLPHANEDLNYLVAINLAGLICQGLTLPSGSTSASATPRQAYLEWLSNRVLQPRFFSAPHLPVTIANILKPSLLSLFDNLEPNMSPEVGALILQRFYNDLPEGIKSELARDVDFLNRAGYIYSPLVSVDDLHFKRNDFFEAAQAAINGADATVQVASADESVTFHPAATSCGHRALTFTHPTEHKPVQVACDKLELLVNSAVEREAILRRNRRWFDSDDDVFNDAVAEIATIDDPLRRIEVASDWIETSPATFYNDLGPSLARNRQFRFEDLIPPRPLRLLGHLRLPEVIEPGTTFREAANTAAAKLIKQEGLLTAIDRFAGLPIPLPTPIVSAMEAMDAQAQRDLVKQLLRWAISPLSRVHFLRVLGICRGSAAYSRLTRRIRLLCLKDEANAQFDCYREVLQFTLSRLALNSTLDDMPDGAVLAIAWYHAHRLYVAFAAADADMTELARIFGQQKQSYIPRDVFERRRGQWYDITYPRNIEWLPFVTGGLSYATTVDTDNDFKSLLVGLCLDATSRLPDVHLALDTTLAGNTLDSFLGGDRGDHMARLLEPEDAQNFSSSALRDLFEHSILRIIDGEAAFWQVILGVLGSLPCYEDLSSVLTDLIIETDFAAILNENQTSGVAALYVASMHVFNTRDLKLCQYLEDQIIDLAIAYADGLIKSRQDIRGSVHNVATMALIDPLLTLATTRNTTTEVHMAFAASVERLVRAWPIVASECRPTIQRLCNELPTTEAQHYWRLLTRLRAQM